MLETHRQYLMEGHAAGSRYVLTQPPHAPRGHAGNELGRAVGSSLEFMEHRDYMPGDDLRRIDWAVYARTDRLTVKLFREEVCPHVDILLDGSASMALEETEKARATLGLVGLLCAAAEDAGYTHAVWLADDGCRRVENSQSVPLAWSGLSLNSNATMPDSLRTMPPTWRPRAMRIVVSDLLFMADPNVMLQHMVLNAAGVAVVQVLAREDVEPPSHGNVRLEDCETGDRFEIYVDTAARKQYERNLVRHQENWSLACRQAGAMFTTIVAEQFVRDWRIDDLLAAEFLRYA